MTLQKQFEQFRKPFDLEKIKETHVHYCTPCYGGQITEPFFRSWSKAHMTFTKYDIPYSVTTSANESLVSRARCHMVAYMMANPKATHLMFIDADINFDCKDILHMIQHDKDIIVGAYPKKDLDWRELERKIKQGKNIVVQQTLICCNIFWFSIPLAYIIIPTIFNKNKQKTVVAAADNTFHMLYLI